MKDAEGQRLMVSVMPYRVHDGDFTPTVCIEEYDSGRLLPLTADQARKLARKLKRAADKLDEA